ncbi:ATP-binding protein [Pontibacter sp. SGAir0037]|uniref:ATP-binding protein n=1 Tax=Pontibacter sp. SGAir0037 TaxID=2571030 RepID=UPI0010CCC0C2|nr:ATP-binding protein [Pontibacter sp. SGAir0037]QCR22951.1 sensor histidine kinase [Pontibacter sp. SGAir0037]
MNKYTIIGVIMLMSISLLGVVGLQLYWINNAIEVKQEQFDRSVNEALAKVVEKLETNEAVSVVTNQMASLEDSSTVPAPKPASPVKVKPTQTETKPKPAAQITPTQAPPKQATAPQKSSQSTTVLKQLNGKEIITTYSTFTPDKANGATDQVIIMGTARADSALAQRSLSLRGVRQLAASPAQAERKEPTFRVVQSDTIFFNRLQGRQIPLTSTKLDSLLSNGKNNRLKINNRLIQFSFDTLRHMATKLDSLKHIEFFERIKADDIASIRVSADSILIYQKGLVPPVYVHGKRNTPGAGVTFWQGATAPRPEPSIKKATATPVLITKPASELKNPTLANLKKNVASIERVDIKKDKLLDVAQKMVVEYVVKDVPLEKRLNLTELPGILKTELQNKGITLDFGYWIVSNNQDTVAVKHVERLAKSDLTHSYSASLFPNDIFDKSDALGIYFPQSKTYALRSLWGMMALSCLFTLVIIATFGTTIHIIYKQKKLSDMKNDFINNMTHEFKTPIATISLATDSITNPKVYEKPERIKYYTNIIREENKRMNAQVENVLQIALLEKNEFKMNLQQVDVHTLIIRAIESINLQIEQRLGHISMQLNALEHELRSDEVHLYNVICNLIDNANKYSPGSPEINLSTQNINGGILIAVEDKGIGMTKDTQQRVFDKFYRVPTGNLHNVKGFGLGLSYVKAIVQAHHGDIKLKSEPGRGSRFEIYLPLS